MDYTRIKKMDDETLKSWIYAYEDFPEVRILIPKSEYADAIWEAYSRFKDDGFLRFTYFTEINPRGICSDFKTWLEGLR